MIAHLALSIPLPQRKFATEADNVLRADSSHETTGSLAEAQFSTTTPTTVETV